MARDYADLIKMSVSGTPGTGTITLGAAVSGFLALGAANDGKTYNFTFTDGANREVANDCLYTNSGTTLTRGTFVTSTTGSPLSLTSAAIVSHDPAASDAHGWALKDFLSNLGQAEIAVTGAVTATLNRMHACSGTSANYTVTLPAVSGNAGALIGFRMATGLTKLVTLDGNASETIDGALTRIMWAGESAILLCDGSNWFKVAGKTIPMVVGMARTSSQTISSLTYAKILLDTTNFDNTAMLADLTNSRFNIKRSSFYVGCVFGRIDVGLAGGECAVGCFQNGSELFRGDIAGISVPLVPDASQVVSLSAGDVVELCLYNGDTTDSHDTLTSPGTFPLISLAEIPSW